MDGSSVILPYPDNLTNDQFIEMRVSVKGLMRST